MSGFYREKRHKLRGYPVFGFDYEEEKHKRDEGGKWATKEGGGGGEDGSKVTQDHPAVSDAVSELTQRAKDGSDEVEIRINTKTGEVQRTEGDARSVTPEQQGVEGAGWVAIHNHPDDTPPSDSDYVSLALRRSNIQEMRVVNTEGTYIIKADPDKWQAFTPRKARKASEEEEITLDEEVREGKWDDTPMVERVHENGTRVMNIHEFGLELTKRISGRLGLEMEFIPHDAR